MTSHLDDNIDGYDNEEHKLNSQLFDALEEIKKLKEVIATAAKDLYRIEVRRQGIGWDDYHTEVLVRTQHSLAKALTND